MGTWWGDLAIPGREQYCIYNQYYLAIPMLQIPLTPAPRLHTHFYAEPVQAGFPSPAQGYEQKAIDLNELMVANPPATYFVRAQGDSMVDAGIRDGDMLVVDFSQQPKHDDIVIAKLDDSFTVKRLYKRRNAIRLCPDNKAAGYEPIVPQEGQTLEIIGVVRWVIHQC